MRRIFCLLCAFAVGCLGCAVQNNEVQEIPTHNVYEMTITATQLSNDSVGQEWSEMYTCEGESIYGNKRWTLPIGTTKIVEVEAVITERDKFPDVGNGVLTVELKDGFETSTVITVVENKGVYRGNQAQWEVVCKVALVGGSL